MKPFRIGEKMKEKEKRENEKRKGIVFVPSITGQSSIAETATMGPHVHIAAPFLCGQ